VSRAALLAAALALGAGAAAQGQTMLDQEQRLIEVHALLLSLPPPGPPGAWEALALDAGLELITVPTIDGTTGGKRQLTASDRTPVFPRPRVVFGLPAPEGLRAFVGGSYLPPITLAYVSSHLLALEAGLAWAPGPLSLGVRAHLVLARSRSPVTDPNTRDMLDSLEYGAGLSAGYRFESGPYSVSPYASAGLVRVAGDFHVESDGFLLTGRATEVALAAGLRVTTPWHLSATAALLAFPGRLVHPGFTLAWTL
jgi:hypothetical protein